MLLLPFIALLIGACVCKKYEIYVKNLPEEATNKDAVEHIATWLKDNDVEIFQQQDEPEENFRLIVAELSDELKETLQSPSFKHHNFISSIEEDFFDEGKFNSYFNDNTDDIEGDFFDKEDL